MIKEDSCIHFRGIQHDTCKAGVDWRALTGGENFGVAKRMPCLRSNNSQVICAQCRFPTQEEVAAAERELQTHMERMREDEMLIGTHHVSGERSTVYVCELCERASRFVAHDSASFMAHCLDAHGVAEADIRAAKGEMSAHLDARDWFQNDDRFKLPDGRALLLRSARSPRHTADPMRDIGKARKR